MDKLNTFAAKYVPMIVRIVRMEFREDYLDRFHELFDEIKHKIRNFPGCVALELHRDPKHATVRYTFSKWNSEADLNVYRKSELFGSVWPRTKAGFAAKPQAYSLELLEQIVGD